MARDPFLIVLALLTVATGIALLVMLARRRRLAAPSTPESRPPASASPAETFHIDDEAEELLDDVIITPSAEPPGKRRLIDDYAIPVSFDRAGEALQDDEPDIGKICPRCGARYGSHHRLCERDNSELAALN